MKILFKYASRSRVENFARGLKSIVENCESQNFHILVSVDTDDKEMENSKSLSSKLQIVFGESKSKIAAVNRDVNECGYDWDVLVTMSDDMIFTKKGFDNIIRDAFLTHSITPICFTGITKYYELDQYIHFNDGNQKANVSTMHIVGRDYFNRFNFIYHPDYVSLWADVENDIVAKKLGCYKYMGDDVQIFKHLHPAWGLAPTDAQYQRTEAPEVWAKDEATFNRRKEMNFGI